MTSSSMTSSNNTSSNGTWTSVEDNLPEYDVWVLVAEQLGRKPRIACLHTDNTWHTDDGQPFNFEGWFTVRYWRYI